VGIACVAIMVYGEGGANTEETTEELKELIKGAGRTTLINDSDEEFSKYLYIRYMGIIFTT
jgi:hypothetical protein